MDPGFDRNGDAFFVGSDMLGSPLRRGRRSQLMEDEQETNFYRQLMDNQQERDHYRQLRHEALPNIDFGMMLAEPRVPYFDPVRDGFDDSLFPNASGHRYLMERRWLGDQNLMSSPFCGGPGDPMGTRARHRRPELEDEMLPDIGPMDMRLLGWWAQ